MPLLFTNPKDNFSRIKAHVLCDFLGTVKVAPHKYVIKTGQP